MTDQVETGTRAGAGRGTSIVLWVLQVLLALVFVAVGLAKLSASPQAVEIFEAMGTASWMPYIIGALEIVGAVALLIPRLTALAAAAFVVLLAGAVISHLIWGGNPVLALVLLILSAVVAWARRPGPAARPAG